VSGTPDAAWIDRLGEALEDYPDPAHLLDAGGRVRRANGAARAIPSLSPEAHVSEHGEAVRCCACDVREALAAGAWRRWHWAAPQGTRDAAAGRYYEVAVWPLVQGVERALLGAVVAWHDVTLPLRLEHHLFSEAEALENTVAERAEEAHRLELRLEALGRDLVALRESQADILRQDRLLTLGQLASSLAHEIHTPLGAILANADLTRRAVARLREPGADRGRALEALDRACAVMNDGGQRIERLVRTLRNFARLDESPVQTVDLHDGLDATIELLGHQLRDRIAVVRDYGDLPLVACRPDAVNQVFLNLLINAAQAIEGHGTITVRTRVDGDYGVVEIEDTGTGIAPDNLVRLFEAGFTTKPRGLGTGLGLAICRRIADDHGGTMDADSTLGHGSRFRLRLPLAGAQEVRSR